MKAKKDTTAESQLPENPTKIANANLPPKFIKDEDFKAIYANFVVAGFSPFDVSLMIGEAMGADEDGRQVIHQKARLTMAASEAKVVMLILANTLKIYEEQFGEVKIPDNQLPAVK